MSDTNPSPRQTTSEQPQSRPVSLSMWRRQGKAQAARTSKPLQGHLLSPCPHWINVLGTRKCAAANICRISGDRGFDRRPEIAITANEFRHAGREPEHVFEHEDLTVTGDTASDADGRYRAISGDAPRERLGHRLNDNRERPRLIHRTCIILDRPPMRFVAPLRAKRADRVDGLGRQPDMTHDGDAALDEK